MPALRIRAFTGLEPMRQPELLKPGQAVVAVNTKLIGGDIEGFGAPVATSPATTLYGGTAIRTIYRFGQNSTAENQFWFEQNADANFVRGPVILDGEERTYYTSNIAPRKTRTGFGDVTAPYPTSALLMGVPKPAAITASLSGSPISATSTPTTVVYAMTFVSSWGEEGAPTALTAALDRRDGQTVVLTGLGTGPSGSYSIAAKRLYRSASGSNATKLQFLAEIPVGQTSFTDFFTITLGEVISTVGYDEPPTGMTGLTSMSNGVLVGFVGNTLCFSEPFQPHAWPTRYQQSVDAPIVGIGVFGQSVFVGTRTGIHVFTGMDPAAMSGEKLPVQQSCASKRSIVEMGGSVVFASTDGLYSIDASGLKNLTESLMTRKEWQVYAPSSMAGYECDNGLILFFDNGSRQGGLVFTFKPEPSLVETDVYATAGFRDRSTSTLYLVIGGNLRKWDAGSPLTWTWRSGANRVFKEVSMSVARISSTAYPLTFRLYVNGVLSYTGSVADKNAFRLPAVRGTVFQVELSGSSNVTCVELATSMTELVSG